jgi:methyltransferase (TIGR00027 family)
MTMSEVTDQNLSGVPATSLITLYIRAIESQRPDALIKDERAEALVRQLDQESLRKTLPLTEDSTRLVVILKTKEFDRLTQDFLARHADAVVVHIGCGLDARFERLAEGSQVEWYDLDLPEVIELRHRLVGAERGRHHLLACSVFDSGWLSEVGAHRPRPFLFLAEGVFMYFDNVQVKSLVLALHEHFPGAELVFDAYSPFLKWSHNLRVTRKRIGAHLHWALKHPKDLQGWSDLSTSLRTGSIRLLDDWGFFDDPTPRLDRIRLLRSIEALARTLRIYHFQLVQAEV